MVCLFGWFSLLWCDLFLFTVFGLFVVLVYYRLRVCLFIGWVTVYMLYACWLLLSCCFRVDWCGLGLLIVCVLLVAFEIVDCVWVVVALIVLWFTLYSTCGWRRFILVWIFTWCVIVCLFASLLILGWIGELIRVMILFTWGWSCWVDWFEFEVWILLIDLLCFPLGLLLLVFWVDLIWMLLDCEFGIWVD